MKKELKVLDRNGNVINGIISEKMNVGDADLIQVDILDDGEYWMTISMILYPNGHQWTPWDWTDRIKTKEEIFNTRWLRHDGYGPGIMVGGLPRALE